MLGIRRRVFSPGSRTEYKSPQDRYVESTSPIVKHLASPLLLDQFHLCIYLDPTTLIRFIYCSEMLSSISCLALSDMTACILVASLWLWKVQAALQEIFGRPVSRTFVIVFISRTETLTGI